MQEVHQTLEDDDYVFANEAIVRAPRVFSRDLEAPKNMRQMILKLKVELPFISSELKAVVTPEQSAALARMAVVRTCAG